mmetsp:Transcript_36395/g.120536  ORF Transcript_36395/g.120536 Transcript_36395/m.120536 type:complete len:311 (-) Transcript_36395:123-1055(-)
MIRRTRVQATSFSLITSTHTDTPPSGAHRALQVAAAVERPVRDPHVDSQLLAARGRAALVQRAHVRRAVVEQVGPDERVARARRHRHVEEREAGLSARARRQGRAEEQHREGALLALHARGGRLVVVVVRPEELRRLVPHQLQRLDVRRGGRHAGPREEVRHTLGDARGERELLEQGCAVGRRRNLVRPTRVDHRPQQRARGRVADVVLYYAVRVLPSQRAAAEASAALGQTHQRLQFLRRHQPVRIRQLQLGVQRAERHRPSVSQFDGLRNRRFNGCAADDDSRRRQLRRVAGFCGGDAALWQLRDGSG